MSVADMNDMEDLIHTLASCFGEKMNILFEEDPEIFEGRSTEAQWKAQVKEAALELTSRLSMEVEKVETKLHDGQYLDEPDFR